MKFESAIEKSLLSTIRIETREALEEYSAGTAFIYEYNTEDNSYPFLITTRNLIENAQEGRITLIQGQNRVPTIGKGYTLDIDNFSKLWFCHPDDSFNVAVTPFVPFVKHVENTGVSLSFETFNEKSLFPSSLEPNLTVGDELLYLGYPDSCWDAKNLLPVFRQAIMSLPYSIDFQGKPQTAVDGVVLEGSCGSPVFVKQPFKQDNVKGCLLGLLCSMPETQTDDDGKLSIYQTDDSQTPMGLVIKMDIAIEAITAYLKEKGFI